MRQKRLTSLRSAALRGGICRGLTNPLVLSSINVAELYAAVHDGAERAKLDRFMVACTVLPVDQSIAVAGGLLWRDYGKTHGTGLADALIAATVQIHNIRLVSLDSKHFPMLSDLNNLVIDAACVAPAKQAAANATPPLTVAS